MIQGKLRPEYSEKQYRQTDLDSSSSLATYAKSPQKYFKEYVLNEKDQEENQSMLIGSIVHTWILEGESALEQKYHMSTVTTRPTEKMLDFCHALHRHTMESMDENGVVTAEFSVLLEKAHADSGYAIPLSKVLGMFTDKHPEHYYRELREVSRRNLTVATAEDMLNAERVVTELRTNQFTSFYINLESDWRYEVFNELKIEDYEVDGTRFKSMLDKVIADRQKKTLQIVDLKITWNVLDFFNEYYLKRRTYIQSYLYTKALESVKEALGFGDYEVLPPIYIVADNIAYYAPIMYVLTPQDLTDAYEGFSVRGWPYRGVKDLIADLQWAKRTDNFRTTREAFENQGILPLKKVA